MVVDYRDPGMVEQIRAAAPEGLDVYWDTSGHHDIDVAVAVLARGGRLLLTAAGPRARVPLPVDRVYTHDVTVAGFAISNATVTDLAAAATVLNQKLADRTLTARIADTMTLARAAEAHRRLEKGGVRGRLILMP
ncbi:zinc-binding dehydrogenase [Nocardia aobensis]|uniref:zinc-binding dehydrogenase n=1 Tax=Nocardia aobensis TaxID=257277 RepID=UPI0003154EE2|nr:zinc-binding dehydrogenase [Nocardia aobensis]